MHVLALTNFYPPFGYGYGAICRDVMRGLASRGHDVRILSAGGGEDEDAFPVERRLHHVPAAWRRPIAGLRAERVNQRAVSEALEHGVDAAVAWHMRGIGKGSLTLLHRAGVPVVYALGDLWVVYERPGPPAAWRMWSGLDGLPPYRALRRALGAAAGGLAGVELRPPPIAAQGRCVFASQWLRERYAQEGFAPETARVVPNGIDVGAFPWPPGRPDRAPRRALFAGRVDETKGADVAIDALARLPDLSLTMVGGIGEGVRERIARHGVEDRVRLLGARHREEVVRLMGEHDLFLMPGRIEESFGLVYLEAMASGLPVVGTATGGAAEFCTHESNALIVTPEPAAVAHAVRRLQDDDALRQRLVAEGRRTAEGYPLSGAVEGFDAAMRA